MLLLATIGVGWHYSNEILGPDAPPPRNTQIVLAITDSTMTLAPTEKSRRAGEWAIEWDGGFGAIGPVITSTDDGVITRFRLLNGSPPDSAARLAGFARDADPRAWLGVEFEAVEVPSRVGALPAWKIAGADTTWALFVHGRGATRAEVLRMLPTYCALGLPCLVLSYRNDEGAPRVAGGGYRFGATEWLDLEDAVRFARDQGAKRVVLVGCSMGGGIVAQFLRRSELRSQASVAVLDAPALDWNSVLALAGQQRRVPMAITELGKTVTTLRSGLRWNELVQVGYADGFTTPMLVFHGDADLVVPIEVSERFAAARPDLVTLHRVAGAGHVESANFDRVAYDATLAAWLLAHGIGSAPAGNR
jgi:uncharacterized protein